MEVSLYLNKIIITIYEYNIIFNILQKYSFFNLIFFTYIIVQYYIIYTYTKYVFY